MACLVGLCSAVQQNANVPVVPKNWRDSGGKNARPMTAEEIRRMMAERAAYADGLEAYSRGDYKKANEIYLNLEKGERVHTLSAMGLARTYDKLGDDKGAYAQLRFILYPPKNSFCSYQTDPAVLVYYGDLCERLHLPNEADRSYLAASRLNARRFQEPFRSMIRTLSLDSPTKLLRSTALAVAGLTITSRPKLAERYSKEAIVVDPQSEIARFAYGLLLRMPLHYSGKDAMAQFWMAQRLAGEPFASLIEKYRRENRMFYSGLRIEALPGGKSEEHRTEYVPKGTVPLPSVGAFKTELPID